MNEQIKAQKQRGGKMGKEDQKQSGETLKEEWRGELHLTVLVVVGATVAVSVLFIASQSYHKRTRNKKITKLTC